MTDAELRARAEAAFEAEGGWYSSEFFRAFIDGDDEPIFSEADAAYIAAASPDTILRLLDEKAALEEALSVGRIAHWLYENFGYACGGGGYDGWWTEKATALHAALLPVAPEEEKK
jgi:hypothetical protein